CPLHTAATTSGLRRAERRGARGAHDVPEARPPHRPRAAKGLPGPGALRLVRRRWQPARHLGARILRAGFPTDPGRRFARVGTCSENAGDSGDFVLAWRLERLLLMLIRDLMQREVATLKASESLGLAEDIMHLGRIRHLPVVSAGVVVGIVSQRDLYRAAMSSMLQLRRSTEREWLACIPVRAMMTTDVITVAPGDTIHAAIELMLRHRIGCLPVVEHGKL